MSAVLVSQTFVHRYNYRDEDKRRRMFRGVRKGTVVIVETKKEGWICKPVETKEAV